ncbi:MAG TPA: hypothetical protein VLA66_09470, partial [Thermoanaerobaculia bacterium]|nr:hypothetical protein [Thermoanaerobaculia bacterium]
ARLEPEQRLDLVRLAAELSAAGTPATAAESVEALADELVAEAVSGDVVITMSSGSFEGLPRRIVALLGGRVGAVPGPAPAG